MFKRAFLVFTVLLLGGLAACGTPAPQPTATPVPDTATPRPSPTPAPAEPSPTPEPTATTEVDQVDAGPTPTPPWQIPEIQPDDWVKGGSAAGLTVVEYSDFQ